MLTCPRPFRARRSVELLRCSDERRVHRAAFAEPAWQAYGLAHRGAEEAEQVLHVGGEGALEVGALVRSSTKKRVRAQSISPLSSNMNVSPHVLPWMPMTRLCVVVAMSSLA